MDTALQRGLTRADEGGRVFSLILATLLMLQPRVQLAFFVVSMCCWDLSGFLTIKTTKILLLRTTLNPLFASPIFVLGIALTWVQDLVLGLVKFHEVYTDLTLKLVQVPLKGIPSLLAWSVDHTRQCVLSVLLTKLLNSTSPSSIP